MTVELEGEPDERGMLLDFKILKHLLAPLVEAWDHAILAAEDDEQLVDVIRQTGWKHALLPFDTTAENLCRYVASHLCDTARDELQGHHIHTVRVRLEETETCYAEAEQKL